MKLGIPRSLPFFVFAVVFALFAIACSETHSFDEYFSLAKTHYDSGDTASAIIELKNALSLDPKSEKARLLLGLIYVGIEDGASAEKELVKARELGASRSDVTIPLARARLLRGDYSTIIDEAVRSATVDAQAVSGLTPTQESTLLAIQAHAFLATGARDKADALYQKALSVEPAAIADIALGKARISILDRRYGEAWSWLQEALAADPESVDALSLKGDLEREQGKLHDAETSYSAALSYNANRLDIYLNRALARIQLELFTRANEDIQAVKRRAPQLPRVHYTEGLLHLATHDHEKAITAFRLALKFDPDLVLAEYLLASAAFALEHWEQAAQHLGRVLATYPDSTRVRRMLAAARLRQSDYPAVESLLRPALALRPDDTALLRLLAQAKAGARDYEGAARVLEQAAAGDSDDASLSVALGAIRLAEGKTNLALQALESSATLKGSEGASAVVRALAYMDQGKMSDALNVARELKKQFPSHPEPYNLAGLVHLESKNERAAKEMFLAALERVPGDPAANSYLAVLSLRRGDIGAARKRYLDVLEHFPDNLVAQLQLALLENRFGRHAEAGRWLKLAAGAHPNALSPSVLLMTHHLAMGHPKAALAVANKLPQRLRSHPDVLALKGQGELSAGLLAQAVETGSRLARAQPKLGRGYFLQARALSALGETEAASQALERVLQVESNHLGARIATVKSYALKGNKGDMESLLRELRQQHPNSAEMAALEGWLALRNRDGTRAREAYAVAVEHSRNRDWVMGLAEAEAMAGDENASLATLEAWVAEHGKDLRAKERLASWYLIHGREMDARNLYMDLVQSDPNHVNGLNNLAWLYRNDDLDKAHEFAEKAYTMAPENPAVLDTFGVILIARGNTERAVSLLQKASNNMPEGRSVRFHLAQALARHGSKREAYDVLSTLLVEDTPFQERDAAKRMLLDLGRLTGQKQREPGEAKLKTD